MNLKYLSGSTLLVACLGIMPAVAAPGPKSTRDKPREALFGVAHATAAVVVAVGRNGLVLRSADGGRTWERQRHREGLSEEQVLRDVTFCSPNLGIAVGEPGLVLRTEDAGLSWKPASRFFYLEPVEPATVEQPAADSSDADTDAEDDEGAPTQCDPNEAKQEPRTRDNATAPQLVTIASREIKKLRFHAVACSSEKAIWIVGEDTLFRSADGGGSYELVWRTNGEHLNDVIFANDRRGWIVGENGLVLRTVDGGDHFMETRLEDTRSLLAASFADELNGLVVGESGSVHVTADGGRSFIPEEMDSRADLVDVQMLDPHRAVTIGEEGVYTRDQLGDWRLTFAPNDLLSDDLAGDTRLKLLSLSDTVDGGLFSVGTHGLVVHSGDSGTTWQAWRSAFIGNRYDKSKALSMREKGFAASVDFSYSQAFGEVSRRYGPGVSVGAEFAGVISPWIELGAGLEIAGHSSDETIIAPAGTVHEEKARQMETNGFRIRVPLISRIIAFDQSGWSLRIGLKPAFVAMDLSFSDDESSKDLAEDNHMNRQRFGFSLGQDLVLTRRFARWNPALQKYGRMGISLLLGIEEAWTTPSSQAQKDLGSADNAKFSTELWFHAGLGFIIN